MYVNVISEQAYEMRDSEVTATARSNIMNVKVNARSSQCPGICYMACYMAHLGEGERMRIPPLWKDQNFFIIIHFLENNWSNSRLAPPPRGWHLSSGVSWIAIAHTDNWGVGHKDSWTCKTLQGSKLMWFWPVCSEMYAWHRYAPCSCMLLVETGNLPVVLIIHFGKKRTQVRNEASLLPRNPSVPVKDPITQND